MQVVSPGGIIGPPLNNQKHLFTLDNTHHTLKRNETNSFTMLLSQIATKTNQLWQKSRTSMCDNFFLNVARDTCHHYIRDNVFANIIYVIY